MRTIYTLDYLMKKSNLPGPRGNLELLYDFSKDASAEAIDECLHFIKPDTANSPEEFVGMCGILGYAVAHKEDNAHVIAFLARYASHTSWRIREAVAMGIQEISVNNFAETLKNIRPLANGNYLEQRSVVAGLCEPKLLKEKMLNLGVLSLLYSITRQLAHDNRLSDGEESLRKALGYGWSVVIAAEPENGKKEFERLFGLPGKHIRWIMKENLKKNRLIKMDPPWVASCLKRLEISTE